MKTYKWVSFLNNVDIFGYAVSLNIRQNDKYTTAVGGGISLLIIGITALFFQTNVGQFFKKVNINSDVSTMFYDDPDQIILEKTGMMFAVSILQTNFSTNPYFNVTVEQRSYIRHEDGTKTKIIQLIDLVPCTIDRFQRVFDIQGTNFPYQYNQLGFDTWLCPARGAQLSMRGLHSSTEFNFVKISVSQCSNDTANNQNLTWKPICQSQDSIDKYLNRTSSFQIQFYSTDYILNAHQPINYLRMFLNNEIFSTFIPYKMVKYTDIFFKKYNFANNVSLTPIADIQQKSVNIKDINDFRESVEIGNSADTEYAGLYLRCSQFDVNVTRTFQKIGNLLSFLGGFVQFMITIFGVCKLKNLLLQKHQIILFNFTPKPNITLEDQKILPSRLAVTINRSSSFNKIRRKSVIVKDPSKISMASEQAIDCLDIDSDIKIYYLLQKVKFGQLDFRPTKEFFNRIKGGFQPKTRQEQIMNQSKHLAENVKHFYTSHLIDFQDDKFAQAQNSQQVIQPTTRNKIVSTSLKALEIKIEQEPSKENVMERSSPINDIVQRHLGYKNQSTTTQQ